MMIVSIYGAGYVGLVTGVCFAKLGHRVICTDINPERIAKLQAGECPIYEKDLPELLIEQINSGRLQFTTDVIAAAQQGSVHFIATGTPSLEDGNAYLSQVRAVAIEVARHIQKDGLLVTKSTVPVGTGDELEKLITAELANHNKITHLAIMSNPEFLREGCAVHDFLNADRIVIGGEGEALAVLAQLYQPLVDKGIPLLTMSRKSAELTKYTANALLACKISFMNQISRIAEKVGANIDEIREGIASDHRIGPHFLQAGIGYGGSCFPKDGRAIIQTAKRVNENTCLLEAVDKVNELQKNWVFEQLCQHFKHDLANKTIAIWGLSFKPGTDDMREASSLVIMNSLLKANVKLRVYDPVAMPAAKQHIAENSQIHWCDSVEETLDEIDALVIATEWPIFKNYALSSLTHSLKNAPIFDGRNCYTLQNARQANLLYYSVGRPHIQQKDSHNAS
jgi:UDPglucose 6-dehydrogenase